MYQLKNQNQSPKNIIEYKGDNPFSKSSWLALAISSFLNKNEIDRKQQFNEHIGSVERFLERLFLDLSLVYCDLESSSNIAKRHTLDAELEWKRIEKIKENAYNESLEQGLDTINFIDQPQYQHIIDGDDNKNRIYDFVDTHSELKDSLNKVFNHICLNVEKFNFFEDSEKQVKELEIEITNLRNNILPENPKAALLNEEEKEYAHILNSKFGYLFHLLEKCLELTEDCKTDIIAKHNELIHKLRNDTGEILDIDGDYNLLLGSSNNNFNGNITREFDFYDILSKTKLKLKYGERRIGDYIFTRDHEIYIIETKYHNLPKYLGKEIGNFYINLFYRSELTNLFNTNNGSTTLDFESYLSKFESREEGLKILGDALLNGDNNSRGDALDPKYKFLKTVFQLGKNSLVFNEIDNETKFRLLEKFLDKNEVIYGIPEVLVNFVKSVNVTEVPDYIKFKLDDVFLRETADFYKLDIKFREIFLENHKESIEGGLNDWFNFDPGVYIHQDTYKNMILAEPDENRLYEFISKHFNPCFSSKYQPFMYNDYFQLLHGYLKDYHFTKNKALIKLFIYPRAASSSDEKVAKFAQEFDTIRRNDLKSVFEEYIKNLHLKAKEITVKEKNVDENNYQSKFETVLEELRSGTRKAVYKDRRAQEIYEFFS